MAKMRVVLSNGPATPMLVKQWTKQTSVTKLTAIQGTKSTTFPNKRTPNVFEPKTRPDRDFKAIKHIQANSAKVSAMQTSNFIKGWVEEKIGIRAAGISLHGTGKHTLTVTVDYKERSVEIKTSGNPIKFVLPVRHDGGAYSWTERAADRSHQRYGEYHFALPIYYITKYDKDKQLYEVGVKLLNVFWNNDAENLFNQAINVVDEGYSSDYDQLIDGTNYTRQLTIDLTPINQKIDVPGVEYVSSSYIGDAFLPIQQYVDERTVSVRQTTLTLEYNYPDTSDTMTLNCIVYTRWTGANKSWVRTVALDDVSLHVNTRNRNSQILTSAISIHTSVTKTGSLVTEVANAVFNGEYDPSSYTNIKENFWADNVLTDIVALQPQYKLYVNGRYLGIKTAVTSDKTVTYNIPADIPKSALEANKQPDIII